MKEFPAQKTIAAVTGTRAEFGLLRPVLDALLQEGHAVRLLVTGAHLVPELGGTMYEIEKAGYAAAERIDILGGNPATPMGTAFPRAFSGFFECLTRVCPDLLLLLGDRYETLAAALAASFASVPAAHISGGDVTEGAKDDAFRHCITKLSSLHFPSAEPYRWRVIQLGEPPARVWNFGSLGAENALTLPVIPAKELSRELGFSLERPFLLITYHPETLGGDAVSGLNELLDAVDASKLPALFTGANADDGGDAINRRITRYAAFREDVLFRQSLGAVRYLSAMRCAAAVVGNSSSAVVEAPSLKVPAVNIGDRQKGRVMGANVISCAADAASIGEAIGKALSPAFRESIRRMVSPYGGENVSGNIAACISRFLESGENGVKKSFFDLPFADGGCV